MKKVVILCGSPRPEGNTAQVTEECADVIRDQGLEAEVISLSCRKKYRVLRRLLQVRERRKLRPRGRSSGDHR